ncbi:hypothetical protein SAMN05444920_12487 [Nonomuraea solani]|uniref:ABC-2 type transport system permease protein n=1 Tax=Nonomuraea solani TaxID=1144553 RepID=A0A1H6EWJ8_9ACTN|nr:hypothetical protein SAMN05444920_12487 [Nonomuraea solani]
MTRALVAFEAGRLLRSPILWGATALALVVALVQSMAWLPDLTMMTIDAVTASAIIAAATLMSASLAAGRDGRHGMPETLGALPAPAEARTRAVVLTAPPVGAALAALMISAYLLFPWRPGPLAGRFDVGEALTGVALAAPAAALGAVLARLPPGSPGLLSGAAVEAVVFVLAGLAGAAPAVRGTQGKPAALAGAAALLVLYAGVPHWGGWLVAVPFALLVLALAHRDVR